MSNLSYFLLTIPHSLSRSLSSFPQPGQTTLLPKRADPAAVSYHPSTHTFRHHTPTHQQCSSLALSDILHHHSPFPRPFPPLGPPLSPRYRQRSFLPPTPTLTTANPFRYCANFSTPAGEYRRPRQRKRRCSRLVLARKYGKRCRELSSTCAQLYLPSTRWVSDCHRCQRSDDR